MMKILYSYRTDEERKRAIGALSEHEVIYHEGSLQDAEWDGEGIEALAVFVDSVVSKEELEKLPHLKLIATKSTGFDHIDLELAKKGNITVCNVPAYGEHTVAEFAFALLLTLTRNILEANDKVVKDGSFSPEGLLGSDLFGKTIGIVGTGKIGRNVIRIAKCFGMNVLAYDLYPDEEFAKEIGFKYVNMDELCGVSDIVSLHLPEDKTTHHIIDKDRIAKMKKGVILINTARGSIVDTEALVWGLENKIISAAGIDVLAEEGNINDEMHLLSKPHPNYDEMKTLLLNHYLIDHPKVIITPHTAFNTKEAIERILDTTFENIMMFMKGSPQNVI
jgi:D-lactate dehydrogenase